MIKKFCERIKELRLEKNLSAVQLAKILEVADTSILKWEKGEVLPTVDKILLYAKYFKVSSDYLLGLED